ncbi:MAG: phosphoenolpyruvate carboxykinase domain-containing protein, partial [Candidatus Sericytochromatia bacterium]
MNALTHRLLAACLAAPLGGCMAPEPAAAPPGPSDPLAIQRAATLALAPFIGRLSVDDVPDGTMRAGQSAHWRFRFLDGPGRAPLTRFSIHHDKPMHLVVVSRDLSHFAHLHPALVADGSFEIRVNARTTDPDNADAATAVPRPGTYFLFSEVAPVGRSATVTRFTVRAEQAPSIAPDWDAPTGVPLDAIIFGGRRPSQVPLVMQARDWEHG